MSSCEFIHGYLYSCANRPQSLTSKSVWTMEISSHSLWERWAQSKILVWPHTAEVPFLWLQEQDILLVVLWSSGNFWPFSWENSLMSFSRNGHWACRCYFFSYSQFFWRKANDPLTVVSCRVIGTRIAQWLHQLQPWIAAAQDGAAKLSLKRAGALACSTATAALNQLSP